MVLSATESPPATIPHRLSMKGITKRFPGVLANDNVSFDVRPGEVHALLGENGAGKTTLMNILYGIYQADSGSMSINGKPVQFRSPKDAMREGIGLVAQHFHLARRHSVAENIGLGLGGTHFFYPVRALETQIKTLGETYGLAVDPKAKVWQLSPGEQQRVEILKALIQGAKILILDEPTSVLTPQEAESLFAVLRRMRAEGEAVIFISHKLDEVMEIADRITVLRKGAVVTSMDKAEASPELLAQHMMGKAVAPLRPKTKPPVAKNVLELKNVSVKNKRGMNALKSVSFELHHGEILGVAGVAGNGQAELIEILTGLHQPNEGQIMLDGKDITSLNAKGLFEAGVAHIPEDRNHMGVVPSMTVSENLVLRQYRYPPFVQMGLLNWAKVNSFAQSSIKDYQIATPSRDTLTRLLSGGNVQKVILARELSGEPRLVVAAHPTYGLDVSATALTHDLLLKQRERGAGVLLVSEDLDELLKLADRILVLFAGELMGVVDAATTSRETIGLLMVGRRAAA
ncbi:MAG: ABC transporter ATP-binding protein [Trueperaceae bacterium]|nr:ABC transporter ATP-binding protein [Trueperaceae bacterium]